MTEAARAADAARALRRRTRIFLVTAALALLAVILFRPIVIATSPVPPGRRIVLWHSQRGAEKDALEELIRAFNVDHAGELYVEPLNVPDGSMKDKLIRTVPRGGGPDVFIRPHNELGELVRDGVPRPLSPAALPFGEAEYLPGLLDGTTFAGVRHGAPLTYKALLLFYNTRLLPDGPPATIEELIQSRSTLPSGSYPLAYDATSFFFHAPFFLAAGGQVFAASDERFTVFEGPGAESFRLSGRLRADGVLPPEPTYNEMLRLFEGG